MNWKTLLLTLLTALLVFLWLPSIFRAVRGLWLNSKTNNQKHE